LVTIDWDAQGRVIGVEAIGSAARDAISACVAALKRLPAEDSDALHRALDAVTGETTDVGRWGRRQERTAIGRP
jgi:hypothetical protein